MSIERPERAELCGSIRRVGPATFDPREIALADALLRHMLLRDACLAPAGVINEKLDLLDLHAWEAAPGDRAPTGGLGGRVSVVAQMSRIRNEIRDAGSLLTGERRSLVLLEVLVATPTTPCPGLAWSRTPVDLLAEAAACIGYDAGDLRRLARRLDIARHALPPVEIGPSTTRAVAESLRSVLDLSPAAGVAYSILLLSDRVPAPFMPAACGGVLLDPGPDPSIRFLGTLVARHDLGAYVDDLAALRVAADISPTIHRYASVMLPELAEDLRTAGVPAPEQGILQIAADLTTRTATLLPRGFRRTDRTGRPQRFHIAR